MQRAHDTFHLLDLASQAQAVQALLVGRPLDEKVAWFNAHGKLSSLPPPLAGARQVYSFESSIGMRCLFFIDNDDLVIVGDNTTRSVPRRTTQSPTGPSCLFSVFRNLLARRPGR